VSCVVQNIDPPGPHTPLYTASVSPPPQQRQGVQTRRAERGVGGQYFGRRETYDWPLTVIISLRSNPTHWQLPLHREKKGFKRGKGRAFVPLIADGGRGDWSLLRQQQTKRGIFKYITNTTPIQYPDNTTEKFLTEDSS
jgi:hypothetical protein